MSRPRRQASSELPRTPARVAVVDGEQSWRSVMARALRDGVRGVSAHARPRLARRRAGRRPLVAVYRDALAAHRLDKSYGKR